jgi:hypothetical protein
VALERECCAFAAWSVRTSVDQLTVEISGESEEAVTAVQALFSGLRATDSNARAGGQPPTA